jgi:hypothetical protein
MLNNKILNLTLASVFLTGSLFARENVSRNKMAAPAAPAGTLAEPCTPARAQSVLAINNVRTTILAGGDMWWDLTNGRYEIPKGSNRHSLFAGALWIGGLEEGTGTLKVAAMTYRQTGNDFWPGPLNLNTVSIENSRCNDFDKHFRASKADVANFRGGGDASEDIKNWPGNGDAAKGEDLYLAPFFDKDGDTRYKPEESGDYPFYDFDGSQGLGNILFGDETLWWVFNDKGNIHSETQGVPIGLEIHAQAFGFQTNDEINNMTFYRYKIFNRSSTKLEKTYFGQWVDPDLGNYQDDWVGCDVEKGFGYVYNGDPNDENAAGYGLNPPALGVDFFQGPIADANDGVDNDRDCIVDEPNEQIIMSKFVYYNNDFSPIGNPEIGPHFYGYLKGLWKDGTPMVYNGVDGWINGGGAGPVCNFMFPGDSDQKYGWGLGGDCANPKPSTPWCETATPADRRFLQSAGPFTLQPGAVNYITVGVIWGRSGSYNGCKGGSVSYIRQNDEIAQELFDNAFKLPDGPDAPTLTIQELDKELLFYIDNKPASNNYKETYREIDPRIPSTPAGATYTYDKTYDFQGYIVYQLKSEEVSVNDLYDETKAIPVFQCDLKDGVAELVNFSFDPAINANFGKVMVKEVEGFKMDDGIKHSFKITEDKFAIGSSKLVNHKKYYFVAVAYGYNSFKKYKQDADVTYDALGIPTNDPARDGQKIEFLPGRLNIIKKIAIPHTPMLENGGTIATAYYGQGLSVKRIKGKGAGSNFVDLTDETLESMSNDSTDVLEYKPGKSPIEIKVIDPLNVPSDEYTLKFINGGTALFKDSKWEIRKKADNSLIATSDTSISVDYEQLIPELGLSVKILQSSGPFASGNALETDFIGSEVIYKDDKKRWLTGVVDIDGCSTLNWIRSGTQGCESNPSCPSESSDFCDKDNDQFFEKILGGTWAPAYLGGSGRLTFNSRNYYYEGTVMPHSPIAAVSASDATNLCNRGSFDYKLIRSFDLIITSDKSKWTRSPIFEMGEDNALNENGGRKFLLRRHNSVDKNGNVANDTVSSSDPNSPNYISGSGMGWFPGYAVDPISGERLNIAFGEDSRLIGQNGADMKWNPTSTWIDNSGNLINGGKHVIYIYNTDVPPMPNSTKIGAYDAGWSIVDNIRYGSNWSIPGTSNTQKGFKLGNVFKSAMWVNIPLLAEGQELLSSDVHIKIRVPSAYAPYPKSTDLNEYEFSTKDIATITNNEAAAKTALQMVNVVPNPYYAFSEYEGVDRGIRSQVDNRVRITYLPKKCVVSIYTPNGVLVRKYKKDDDITFLDWDLKNYAGINVASGMYLIHIQADGIGEKVLKWFGVLRPIDLDQF